MIQTYVAGERPKEGLYDNRPTLAVELIAAKRGLPKISDNDYFDELLCFERDRSLPALACDQKTALSIANDEPTPASKRRKIKECKTVQLESILDTF